MVLRGEKKFIPLKDLQPVNVGCYPELAIKKLYHDFADRAELAPYFPPKLQKGRFVQKQYFWDVVHTFCTVELDSILEFANTQRNSIKEADQK